MQKKSFILLTLLLVALLSLPLFVNAKDMASLVLVNKNEKSKYSEGDTFTVEVKLEDVEDGAELLGTAVNFDESKLNVTKTTRRLANDFARGIDPTNQVTVLYSSDGAGEVLGDGTLGAITFEVVKGASGTTKISFSKVLLSDYNNTVQYTTKTNELTIDIEAGTTELTSSDVTLASTSEVYTGKAITPTVTVKSNGATLTKDTDYTLAYSNNTNVGTAKVTVQGIGKYTGKVEKTFAITQAIASLTVDSTSLNALKGKEEKVGYTYSGDGSLDVKSSDASVATATLDTANKKVVINSLKAGTTTITISAAAGTNYKAISKTISITVEEEPYTLTSGDVTLKNATATYTGSEIAMEVVVKEKENTLTEGTNYTVTYKNNTNVGTATVTVAGKGRILGTIEKTFTITKATPTITLSNLAQKQGSVKAITYDIKPVATNGTVKVEYEISGEYAEKLPTEIGTYKVKVVLSGDSNLENATQSGELVISKATSSGGGGSSSGGGSSTTKKYSIQVTDTVGGKISPSTTSVEEGSSVTFKITPSQGYSIEDVLVDSKSVGKVESYTFSKVDAKHTITAKYVKNEEKVESGEKPVETKEGVAKFEDVKTTDWYYESVKYAVDNKVFNGISEKEFAPNNKMTRGMLVTVLYRLNGATETEKATFSDVNASMYYSEAIAWAAKKGIVNGVGNGRFAPDQEITREDLATIIARYLGKEEINLETENAETVAYKDEGVVASYALESVKLLREKGLMTGKTADSFDPKGLTTRAEVATLLMRLANKMK